MGRFRPLRSNGGVQVAVVMPIVFGVPAPDAVVDLDPPRPAKKQKVDRRRREHRPEREAMPPEYVKGPGKPGQLHPHWRKSFPDDEEDADGRGKVVEGVPGYGIWRRVPGFWKILASDEGFIMTEGDVCVRTPTVHHTDYVHAMCNGTPERVHNLVCRAFKGRPKPNEVSVDHIGGEELPRAERRQDNRAVNLRWATTTQQRRNQGDRKANSNGEPCLVWEVKGDKLKGNGSPRDTTPVVGAARRFPSLNEAATALGLRQGNLSHVLTGELKTVPGTDGTRYAGEWDPDLADIAKDEEWKEKTKSTGPRLFLSNYGRLQRIYPGGREGSKHYPEDTDAGGYLGVHIDGQRKLIHILVGELFFIGPKPRNWTVWDHKDHDKQNNHILNLHPVTLEVNNTNRAGQRDFYIWPKDNPDDCERCASQSATARAYNLDRRTLNRVLYKRPTKWGGVNKTVGGYCAAWCDEVDA